MDGVVLFGFGERHGVVGAVEAVGAVGDPVGPWDKRGPVFPVAHGVDGVRVENGPVANRVFADAPADLDDGRLLIAVSDLELCSRWWCPHGDPHAAYLLTGDVAAPEIIRSASRDARAMIVRAGLAEPWVGQTLPSLTNRLGTPQARWLASTTLSAGDVPIRAPPTRWAKRWMVSTS